jgi:hypothetical protein
MPAYRTILASLFLAVVLAMGCNLMALPYFLMPSDPSYPPPCKLASDDKEKTVRVAIQAWTGMETRPEFLKIDRELGLLLAQHLQESYKKNKEKVTIVPVSRMEKYKDDHPNWRQQEPQEIGKHFQADYIIDLDVGSITLYEPGSANTLFRGRAEVSIDVVDVHKASEGPIFRKEYTCEYPRAKGPIPAGDSNVAQFRQAFLEVVAREISWLFTSHLVDDDYKCD